MSRTTFALRLPGEPHSAKVPAAKVPVKAQTGHKDKSIYGCPICESCES